MSPEWEIAFLLSFSLYQIQIMSILKYICRHFCEWIYSNVYLLKNTHPKYFWVHYSNDRKQKLQKQPPSKKNPTPPLPPKMDYATPSASISFRLGRVCGLVLRVGPRSDPERCSSSACAARPECQFQSGDYQRGKEYENKMMIENIT